MIHIVGNRFRNLKKSVIASSFSVSLFPKTLNDVIDVDKLKKEEPEDRANIWLGGNTLPAKSVGAFCGLMTVPAYNDVIKNATTCPLALFPVFKGQGNDNYLTMISQFQPDNSSFLITYLEDYKTNQGASNPWMVVTLYDDLASAEGSVSDAGDLILTRGEYLPQFVKPEEAKNVMASPTSLFALYSDPLYFHHLSLLNLFPDKFQFETYIDEIKKRAPVSLTSDVEDNTEQK